MKKLRESFRKAEDNNRTSGRGRISCRYYNELAEILAGRPETEPIGVVASAELEAPAAGENQHEEVIAMDQSSEEEGSEGDKTQDETLDASQDTPPELVGDFVPDEVKNGFPGSSKKKGTKRKKSKLQLSLEWMSQQMTSAEKKSVKRFEENDKQARKEHLEWEKAIMERREEIEDRRRREEREHQARERERERQHQIQMIQIAAAAFRNGYQQPMQNAQPPMTPQAHPPPAASPPFDPYWEQNNGPRFTSL